MAALNTLFHPPPINPLLPPHLPSPSLLSSVLLFKSTSHTPPRLNNNNNIHISSTSIRSIHQPLEHPMTITTSVRLSNHSLLIKDRPILTDVPPNLLSSSASSSSPVDGLFLGATFDRPSSRHVIPLGTLRGVRFLSCFRFKLWWMAQRMGSSGRDVPLETQFLLVESSSGGSPPVYAVFLPLIDGPFRACLQGGGGEGSDTLELCIESGDSAVVSSSFTHPLFVSAGSDPFATISDAVRAVKHHLKTFRTRAEKRVPGILDAFGWCTWDAFYQDVTQEGVESGLDALSKGGVPPKFVIIDDGWQSVGDDGSADESKEKPLMRLTGIKENGKFRPAADPSVGIKRIVDVAKAKYGLKYVYVWHAITGYWGGVRPGAEGMEQYGSKMRYPAISPGVAGNEPGMETDTLTVQGLGLVSPKKAYRFYDELHGYLARAGVDGVKVDVQCILETLGGGLGGRVELTRQYHQALDASVARNFPDNGCIACMSHNTDALYCSKQTAVVRASDDFYPRDPVSHTIHIASISYNSIFLGEFMHPDWDMFHSLHPAAEYHGSARAISGGPIYVSDAPGKHNFDLLRKLVLPDGSILRARLPGRPTQDCLFSDPARDGFSLLKIWNMNKYTGVLGVYNCQGAAWSSSEKKNVFHHTGEAALTSPVRGGDVHLIREASTDHEWVGDCALYRHRDGELVVLPHGAAMPVTLKVLEYEIFVVSPIKDLAPGFRFAPFGLVDMFNAGGAVEGLTYEARAGADDATDFGDCAVMRTVENRSAEAVARVVMEVKGCGRFGAYSSAKPRKCSVGGEDVEFMYEWCSGLLTLMLEGLPETDRKVHVVEVVI